MPRFVTHIDDNTIESLTNYHKYESLDALDLFSSWMSHLLKDMLHNDAAGAGTNEKELSANEQLVDFKVHLNFNPKLECLEDNQFDATCNVVSADYLTNLQIAFQEMQVKHFQFVS